MACRRPLTHWGRVTHICVSKLSILGSDNGLSPGRRQAIIWTNAGMLLIGPLGTNFSVIWSEIHTFSFKKMHLKVSSAKWRPFCLGLNVLRHSIFTSILQIHTGYIILSHYKHHIEWTGTTHILRRKSCHFDEIFVNGYTGAAWAASDKKNHKNDNISVLEYDLNF